MNPLLLKGTRRILSIFFYEDIDNLQSEINLNLLQAVMAISTPPASEDDTPAEYEGFQDDSDTEEALCMTVSPGLQDEMSSDDGLQLPSIVNKIPVVSQHEYNGRNNSLPILPRAFSPAGDIGPKVGVPYFKVPEIMRQTSL